MKMNLGPAMLIAIGFSLLACSHGLRKKQESSQQTEWLVASLLQEKSKDIEISGHPQVVDSPYGEAVYFNGIDPGNSELMILWPIRFLLFTKNTSCEKKCK